MTNLDYLVENLKESYNDESICSLLYTLKNGSGCGCYCKECEFNNTIDVLKYLAEKHSDKIKVTQFEYDLLDSSKPPECSYRYVKMDDFSFFTGMKNKGYFKNINGNERFCEVYERLEVEK